MRRTAFREMGSRQSDERPAGRASAMRCLSAEVVVGRIKQESLAGISPELSSAAYSLNTCPAITSSMTATMVSGESLISGHRFR